jgi:hypothetical protein
LQVGTLGARLFLGRALGLEGVVLALEHDLFLLGASLGDDPLGIVLGVAHRGGGHEAAGDVAEHDPHDERNKGRAQDLGTWHRLLLRRSPTGQSSRPSHGRRE